MSNTIQVNGETSLGRELWARLVWDEAVDDFQPAFTSASIIRVGPDIPFDLDPGELEGDDDEDEVTTGYLNTMSQFACVMMESRQDVILTFATDEHAVEFALKYL
jgi:hypothetical protein